MTRWLLISLTLLFIDNLQVAMLLDTTATRYHCSFDEYLFFPDLISLNAPWGCAKTSILSYRPYSGLKYCQLMHSQLLKMLVWIMRRYVFTKRKLGLIVGTERGRGQHFFFILSTTFFPIDIIIMLWTPVLSRQLRKLADDSETQFLHLEVESLHLR